MSQVFETVTTGILIFVIKDLLEDHLLEPLRQIRTVKGKIDNALKFYAHLIGTPGWVTDELRQECQIKLRSLSCELDVVYKQSRFTYSNKKRRASEAARELIGLSNSLADPKNGESNTRRAQKIKKCLELEND